MEQCGYLSGMKKLVIESAKYYLEYQGLPKSNKRVEKLISQIGEDAVIRMAKERGFKI